MVYAKLEVFEKIINGTKIFNDYFCNNIIIIKIYSNNN